MDGSLAGAAPAPRTTPRIKGSLFLGNLPEMRRDPLGLLMKAAAMGDVTKLKLVTDVYLVNHPDAVQRVLRDNHRNYRKAAQTVRIKPLIGDGLLTSEGEFWRRQRRLAQPAFHRTRIAEFARIMAAEAEALADEWDRYGDGAVVDVANDMSRIALRVIGRTMCGVDLDDDSSDIGSALTDALEITNDRFRRLLFLPRLPTPTNLRFRAAMRVLDGVVDRIIAERRASDGEGEDLLAMFMAARDADTGEGMTDKQLHDEIMTMLLAGHETTANALAWTFGMLASYRNVDGRVAEEARAIAGRIGIDELRSLPYAKQVLLESMRLFPPVWLFAREPIEDDVLGGVEVPAGKMIFICPFTLHRNPEFWPSPERFDPSRFEDERTAGGHRMAYVPFAAGPRQCIGNIFAQVEAQIVLATLARRFRLELTDGRTTVEPKADVTLRQRGGLRMRIFRR